MIYLVTLCRCFFEKFHKLFVLFIFLDHLDNLCNILVQRQLLVTDEDLGWIIHEVVCQFLNFFRPRCREHQRLAVLSDLSDNFANLWLKAHVKHTVRFVQHQIGDAVKIRLFRLNQIEQTAGTRYNNMGAVVQLADLLTLIDYKLL